jgi:hypothetical protein
MDEKAKFRSKWQLRTGELPQPHGSLQKRFAPAGIRAHGGAARQSPFDIIGRYSAFIVVSYLDSAMAQACLPPHLELAPPPGTPERKHPAMYSFGTHDRVHPRFFTLWEYSYAEALVGLPDVKLRHPDGTLSGPYSYMTAVRLNNAFADEIGFVLGFPKKLAKFKIDGKSYSFRTEPAGPSVMSGSFRVSGDVFDSTFPNFQTIERFMLQQPVISQPPLGSLLVTPFHIDTQNALMMPMEASITVSDSSLPGLPAGSYRFPGIDVTAIGGGYHSVHNWTMSPPQPIEV